MTLSTTNVADVGETQITMVVKLADYPSISLTKTFKVIIVCEVFELTFTAVNDITVQPGMVAGSKVQPKL